MTLAPGEVVRRNGHGPKRKPRATVQMAPETRDLLRADKHAGESFDDVIRRWHISAKLLGAE